MDGRGFNRVVIPLPTKSPVDEAPDYRPRNLLIWRCPRDQTPPAVVFEGSLVALRLNEPTAILAFPAGWSISLSVFMSFKTICEIPSSAISNWRGKLERSDARWRGKGSDQSIQRYIANCCVVGATIIVKAVFLTEWLVTS